MANIKLKGNGYGQFGGFTPYGNLTVLAFALATTATGVAIGSNSETPLKIGDVVELGSLPAGMRLDDAQVLIATAMTATTTGKLGFVYADGENDTDVPQDDAYFISGGSLATAARLRATGTKQVVLPKTATLILTLAGADNVKASDMKVNVFGELTGPK